MDKKISLYLYGLTEKYPIFKNIIIYLNKLSSVFYKLIYFCVFLYLLIKKDSYIIPYLFFPFITLVLVKFSQRLFKRCRPFAALKKEPLIFHKNSGSFPSTHSACSMIIALYTAYIFPKSGFILIPMAVITGLARIAALLHYTSDVISGFFIAIFIFFISTF